MFFLAVITGCHFIKDAIVSILSIMLIRGKILCGEDGYVANHTITTTTTTIITVTTTTAIIIKDEGHESVRLVMVW